MRYKIRNLDHIEDIFSTDDGEWYDTTEAALDAKISQLESEAIPWKTEALAALQKNDLYRGGGILRLAVLMRQLSQLESYRTGMKRWNKK